MENENIAERASNPASPAPVAASEYSLAEWLEKTEWVQQQIATFPLASLGHHRADVMRDEIFRLRAALASAPRALAEQQPIVAAAPAGWLYDYPAGGERHEDGETRTAFSATEPTAGWKHNVRPVYTTPAAPVAPSEQDARNAVLEEAAKQCEDIYSWRGAFRAGVMYTNTLNACAAAIRALKRAAPAAPAEG